jgi:hypothetical protein
MALAPNAAYRLLQAKAPAKPAYNPYAYVYGGASPAVAKAIQTQGYKSAYKPGVPPPAAPSTAPPTTPSNQSSQQAAASSGAPTATTTPPGEGIYAGDSAAAYDAYNAAIAASEKDTQSARAQYGFNAQGTNLDPNNQTGIFQQLMHQQAQTSMNNSEDALSRNLGGMGLGAQVAEQGDFQNQADLANTTQGYQALLAQALARKSDASTTLTNALLAARQRQIEQDIQNSWFTSWNQQTPSGGTEGGQGGGGSGGQTPVVDNTPDALARYMNNNPYVATLPKPKAKAKPKPKAKAKPKFN